MCSSMKPIYLIEGKQLNLGFMSMSNQDTKQKKEQVVR